MAYETLLYSVEDGIARITLNRPDSGHTINLTLARELMDAAIAAGETPGVRAVLLAATGSMFGFGGDLKYFKTQDHRLGACLKETTAYLHAAISHLHRMEAPVVVAVQGMAAGAGFSLALVGDIVIAGRSARFRMAYTAAGLTPDGSASHFLPRLVGLRRAQELMLTNRVLDAEEALDWGLVTSVCPDESLMAEAEAMARRMAEGPTRAFGGVKRLLAATYEQSLETQMDEESRLIASMAQTEDGREGLAAFVEKRKPFFKGR